MSMSRIKLTDEHMRNLDEEEEGSDESAVTSEDEEEVGAGSRNQTNLSSSQTSSVLTSNKRKSLDEVKLGLKSIFYVVLSLRNIVCLFKVLFLRSYGSMVLDFVHNRVILYSVSVQCTTVHCKVYIRVPNITPSWDIYKI